MLMGTSDLGCLIYLNCSQMIDRLDRQCYKVKPESRVIKELEMEPKSIVGVMG